GRADPPEHGAQLVRAPGPGLVIAGVLAGPDDLAGALQALRQPALEHLDLRHLPRSGRPLAQLAGPEVGVRRQPVVLERAREPAEPVLVEAEPEVGEADRGRVLDLVRQRDRAAVVALGD